MFLLSAVAAQPGPDALGSDPAVAGNALFAKGDFAGALAAYLRALQAQSNDLDANLGAARVELFCNELDAALEHAHATLGIDPSNAGAAHVVEEITRSLAASHNDRVENLNGQVDVQFLQTDPLPQVAVTVNGHRARLLLDTGAPGLDLSEGFAATAGVTATAVGKGVFAGGRSAQIRMGGKIDALGIGTITAHDVPAGVSPVGPNVDGVLGMNFLDHFLATIDYVHGRLILRPKSASDAFERTAAAAGDTIVPMYLVPDHQIFVRARVNDAPEALFNVDTGGGPRVGVELTKASLAAAHIVPDAAGAFSFMGGGGEVQVEPFVASAVSLGSTTIKNVPGMYVPESGSDPGPPFAVAGRISHAFFRHTELSFDFSAMKLIVSSR